MRYEILDDCKRERLERRVAEAIAFGWEPQGGMALAMHADSLHFAQAMVLRTAVQPEYFNPISD